jgi:hypothetical protein
MEMDNSTWVMIAIWCGLIPLHLYMYRASAYEPDKILQDNGDEVYISHLPKARLFKAWGKTIPKSFVTKIQLAGNCVSLFNASGNAIDIWVPKAKFAKPVYQRAIAIFNAAETVEIDG